MNYIGSKHRLSVWIKSEIVNIVGRNLSQKVFADIFAGTGAVGKIFKNEVKYIISNDVEYYSYVLNRHYIGNHKKIENRERYIEYLNNLPPVEGFIFYNYCRGSGSGRNYFSDTNCSKIDSIRIEIERLFKNGEIEEDLYYFLLASLIESVDRVANTASVYGAFLKNLKKSAQKELFLEGAEYIESENSNQVFNLDSNQLITQIEGDILYLDPPYNNRQYGANYHLLNTIAKYQPFQPQGKTGLPPNYYRSQYCNRNRAKENLEHLIQNAKFRYIFLSYNNEGLLKPDEVGAILSRYGKYSFRTKEYKRFISNRRYSNRKTMEYLHILEK